MKRCKDREVGLHRATRYLSFAWRNERRREESGENGEKKKARKKLRAKGDSGLQMCNVKKQGKH